jgi:signal transduction histidine kinase
MTRLGPDELDFVRDRVIHVVGHELRTPLTTIRGLAELLEGASDEELHHTLIPALVRNARRAEQLLDDLLIAGGVYTAEPVEAPSPVDLAPLVDAAVAGTRVAVEGTPPAPAMGHPETVRDAIGHLVDNAERYADGTPRLSYAADDESVTVQITTPVDVTIPDLELGFELFFRGENAVTRSAGLGIGLPVARALARKQGGDVTIADDDGAVVTRLRLVRA